MKRSEIATYLLKANRAEDFMAVVRYMYRIGSQLVNNDFYDKVHNIFKEKNLATEYINRTYDNDPIPYDLIKEFDLPEYAIPEVPKDRSEYYNYMNEEKSLSIEAITDPRKAYEYAMSVRHLRLLAMIKGDGIFTKSLIRDQQLKISLSRGRTGESWDLTDQAKFVIPTQFPMLGEEEEIKVYGEGFCVSESLEYLAEKYDPNPDPNDRKYKTEKSAAVSMLRKMHQPKDYKYVKVLAFAADGLGESISESLSRVKELGFETIPYMVIEPNTIPENYEEFEDWLSIMLERMWELKGSLPSDGVVLTVDQNEFDESVTHQYSNRNIALKMQYWESRYYPAIVKNILGDQKGYARACRVEIEPVLASDRTTGKIINCFNADILIANGIFPGKRLYFERNSGAVNILIHGGRMKKLELEEKNFLETEGETSSMDMFSRPVAPTVSPNLEEIDARVLTSMSMLMQQK